MKNERAITTEIQKHSKGLRRGKWFVFLLLAVVSSIASAQSSITRYTINGGGGVSQVGTKRISGTIGQPDAGNLSAGNVQISGGFWPGNVSSLTPTPTETSLPTPSLTRTAMETETQTGATPTPTRTEFDFDIGADFPDGFIDVKDLIALISKLRELGIDPQILFKLNLYWQGEYPPAVKTQH